MLTWRANTDDGDTNSSPPSAAGWNNLPDDLLGMVRRSISSPRDRVCLAAVCKSWHDAASRLPAQPAVPVLILSPYGRSKMKHLCSPCGSWVLRVHSKAVKKRFVGSHRGGWIAATDDHQLVIVNLFSGGEVQLTAKQKMIASIPTVKGPHNIKKIIFSQDPASSDGCILAAITHDGDSIAVCRVGCPDGGWSAHPWHGNSFWDIAFYDGELYGLTMLSEILVKVEIIIKEDTTPEVMATHPLPIQSRDWSCYNPMYYGAYIVELHGELLIAVRERWLDDDKYFFRVFKLVDADNDKDHKHKWAQVTCFGEYALFLGWSKAVHVPVGGRHGIKRNHIYYYSPTTEEELPDDKVYSLRTGDGDQVYCREDYSIDDGVGRTGFYLMSCYNNPTWRAHCNSARWLYPPDF